MPMYVSNRKERSPLYYPMLTSCLKMNAWLCLC